MSLSPLQNRKSNGVSETIQPSLTYAFNFETGELESRLIDDYAAIRQAIHKIVRTVRYRHQIYSSDYGTELESVISEDLPFSFLRQEIPRIIKEALEVDNRIKSVDEFLLTREGDALYVSFSVTTIDGLAWKEKVNI